MRLMIVSALFAAAAGGASAQTPIDRGDARCLLAMQVAGRNPANKDAAAQGTYYFLGRLTAHGMSGNMEGLLLSESKSLSSATAVQAELTRCAAELTARSAELRATFATVAQLARPAAIPKAPGTK